MEQYIVSARKYRPATFASVVGQSALTSTLKNAIASKRLAQAYLFCGSRGVGKTSCARIFAKTINCLNPGPDGEACNECDSCKAFNEGNSMNIIELDAASHNGIEDMKSLIEQVQVPPTRGRYRVFIIDEVHMLSTAAFNAFLKTLEEPPSYVIFILATTEKHKIIPTILSRCQIYDFNRITIADMVNHLGHVAEGEGITAEPAALNVIARQADGAMRDALSIFDQVAASCRGNITYDATIANLNVLDSSYYTRLVEAFVKGEVPAALLVFHEIRAKGFDAQFFINGLGQYLRDLMLASSPATLGLLDVPDDVRQQMAAQAAGLKPEFLYAAMGLCNDADLNYRAASSKQLLVEITLIRIAQLLSPPPSKSGQGGGPLKPIARSQAPQATPAATTQSAPAPQQVQPAAPQAVPRAATPAAAAARRPRAAGSAIRVGGLSMQVNKAADTADKAVHRSEPVTAEALSKAWLDYSKAHSAEPAISNAMNKFVPELAPDGRWVVVVDSVVTSNLIGAEFEKLVPYLRDSLRNDDFNLNINISSNGIGPEFWSDTTLLNHMLESPDFAEFYRIFHLTMR
ncbi:MAG: DNA polymerase III subunit gamma/tau [Muribaculaceae bacterium]